MRVRHHPHTPVHIYQDDSDYFITAAIYRKRPLLAGPELKERLLDLLQGYFHKHSWVLQHWVIFDNHYHLMGKSRRGADMETIFRQVHSLMAKAIRNVTDCEKPVWWNYWDYCPRDERDYLIRLNYLLYNPIRHGYVTRMSGYPYSSFHRLLAETSQTALTQQFQAYSAYKTLVLHEAQGDDF